MRTIRQQPDEDTPRLAFADRLDELQVRPRHAELIRMQCNGCTIGNLIAFDKKRFADGSLEIFPADDLSPPMFPVNLQYREVWDQFDNSGVISIYTTLVVDRGFIGEVVATAGSIIKHAVWFFGHPVAKVTLTDRAPCVISFEYEFYKRRGRRDYELGVLPRNEFLEDELFDLLTGKCRPLSTDHNEQPVGMCATYDSREAATRDLSDVCVLYGRRAWENRKEDFTCPTEKLCAAR